MSAFKGDRNYRPVHDVQDLYWEDESDEEVYTRPDPVRHRSNWLNFHYDVLSEIYQRFRGDGERVFGACFCQRMDFADFINFVYEHTHLDNADLLKARSAKQHVCSLGVGTRSESGVHSIPAAAAKRPPRKSNSAVSGGGRDRV